MIDLKTYCFLISHKIENLICTCGQEPPSHGDGEKHVDDGEFDVLLQELKKEDATPFYEGCKTRVLSFTIKLLEWKVMNGITNTAHIGLLELLREHLKLPNLPANDGQAKSKLTRFGLSYNQIDASKNNCMIYYKDRSNILSCSNCGTPQYRPHKGKTFWNVL